ncbi:MAG: beta-galactosidase [Planctomycetota bacterium]|jgi:hypothetical protein
MPLNFKNKHLFSSCWGTWESLSFYKRNGYGEGIVSGALWLDRWYEYICSEEVVRKLSEAGINSMIGHYWKGFGLEAEQHDMEAARKKIDLCNKYNIDYYAYVQYDTLSSETFFKEVPEARGWIRKKSDGQDCHYLPVWRKEPCIRYDEFNAYIKKVIKMALDDGAAGIMLDNLHAQICYCEKCREDFRDWVKKSNEFTAEKLNLNYIDYDSIELPRELIAKDPLVREFFKFRKQKLEDVSLSLKNFIHSINPDAVFMPNVAFPRVEEGNNSLSGNITFSPQDIMYPEFRSCIDALKNDGAPEPVFDEQEEVLPPKLYRFKLAHDFGYPLFGKTFHTGYGDGVKPDKSIQRQMSANAAVGLALGGNPLSFNGLMTPNLPNRGKSIGLDNPVIFNTAKKWNEFVKANSDIYKDAQSAADIILGTSELGFCITGTQPMTACHAAAVEMLNDKVLFRFKHLLQLESLVRENTLLLIDMYAMSDSECEQVISFYKRGGKVILLGPCSTMNENGQERLEYGLSGLLSGSDEIDMLEDAGVIEKDRLFWDPSVSGSSSLKMQRRYTDAGRRDSYRIQDLVRDLNSGPLSIEITADKWLCADFYNTPDGTKYIHLANMSVEKNTADAVIQIDYEINKKELEHIEFGKDDSELDPEKKGDSNIIRLTVGDYSVVKFK